MLDKFNEWFDIYNRRLFNNELPRINIKKSHGKKRLGCYRYRSGRYKPGTISISTAYNFDDNKFKEILIHEMIHAYIHYKDIYDDSSHGREFTSIMNRVNDDLKDESIKITVKTEDLDKYEIKNKVSYPFMLFSNVDNMFIIRIAKSRITEYKARYSTEIDSKFFYSDNDFLNRLKKSINNVNLYEVKEGNEIYNELVKEGVFENKKIEYKSSKEQKITIYAVHIAKKIFRINIPEEVMKHTIFDIKDDMQEECLDIVVNSPILASYLPICVNDILDSIISLAKGAYENGYGGLNGFDDKYIK